MTQFGCSCKKRFPAQGPMAWGAVVRRVIACGVVSGCVVVCLAAGWLGIPQMASAQTGSAELSDDQQQAIAAIEAAGGRVMTISAEGPQRDVAFHLSGKPVSDDQLKPLGRIPHIIWLNLRGAKITDDGLAHLSPLKGLTRLHLEKTEIGDDGLAHLSDLTELEYLNLYGTKVSDKGLEHLNGLTKLKRLFVWQTGVTDAGIDALKKQLPELEIIGAAKLEKAGPIADEKPNDEKSIDETENKSKEKKSKDNKSNGDAKKGDGKKIEN